MSRERAWVTDVPSTVADREATYDQRLAGQRFADMAEDHQCSVNCVRKW
jgi:uncharacterized protein YjcR